MSDWDEFNNDSGSPSDDVFDWENPEMDSQSGTESSDDWGTTIDDISNQSDDWDDIADNRQQSVSNQDVETGGKPLGTKVVALILAGVLLVIAIILMVVKNTSITKKGNDNQVPEQVAEVTQSPNSVQSNQVTTTSEPEYTITPEITEVPQLPESTPEVVVGTEFKEIPDGTDIDYSVDIQETSGSISGKKRFLLGEQVIYLLEISIGMENSVSVNYYCGYNVYDSVSIGDTVTVSYQKVSDTCYSVNTISK